MRNAIQFKLSGKYALFSDPITKMGGEKFSYQIPTFQALKGIVESIYWKPTLVWHVDRLRVMKAVRTQSQGVKPVKFVEGGSDLSIYTYLADVEYQVEAHFEWNEHRPDLSNDRDENKHHNIAKRMVQRGGRRDIFLGTRECQGYVEPCAFGEGQSFYDHYGEISFGLMFHSFDYPSESGETELYARLWVPTMKDGIVDFTGSKELCIRKHIKSMELEQIRTSGWREPGLWEEVEKDGVDAEIM